MRRDQRRQASGYATKWAWSYILPIACGLLLYLLTRSATAAVTGTVAGFIVFAVLASGRGR
jgi:branched-subunit amino acid transport protein